MDNYTDYVMYRGNQAVPVNTPAKLFSGYQSPLRANRQTPRTYKTATRFPRGGGGRGGRGGRIEPSKRTYSERESPSSALPGNIVKMARAPEDRTPMDLTQAEKDLLESKDTPGWGFDQMNMMFKRLSSMESNLLSSIDKKLQTKLDTFTEEVQQQVDVLDTKVSNLSYDVRVNREAIRKERTRVNHMEVKFNRHNIMFSGFPEKKGEKKPDLEKLIRDQIAKIENEEINTDFPDLENCEFENIYRDGQFQPGQRRPRDIKVMFMNVKERNAVYKGRFSFNEGRYANHELPQELAHAERQLRPIKKLCEGTPYGEKGRVFVVKGNLIVDDRVYTIKTLFDLPPAIKFWSNNVRTNLMIFSWHGILCPFSNFFWCTLIIDGEEYDFAEKFINKEKALLFGDEYQARAICAANDPYECRKLGKNIKGFKQSVWDAYAPEVAAVVIKHKVGQNPKIQQFLKDTHPKKLSEASKESKWGCGFDLHDKDLMDYRKWPRIGHAGEVYMALRDELLGINSPTVTPSSSDDDGGEPALNSSTIQPAAADMEVAAEPSQ